jgi:Cu(I)/Ag(I) efflux system membrane protein CusA/SilA
MYITFALSWWLGLMVTAVGAFNLFSGRIPARFLKWGNLLANGMAIAVVTIVLTGQWLPLGPERWFPVNLFFVALLVGGLLGFYLIVQRYYGRMLTWCLVHKAATMSVPLVIIFLGLFAWLGFHTFFGWLPGPIRQWGPVSSLNHAFPGFGKEFMPPLDEGSYLFMPTTMPHASIGEAYDILRKQDMAINALPEVESAVGKLGRAETPLDPAPVSMIETVINYHPEYLVDEKGEHQLFRFDSKNNDFFRTVDGVPVPAPDGEPYRTAGTFLREDGNLIPDPHGKPFRLWRPALAPQLNPGRKPWNGIKSPDDIWDEIVKAAEVPGVTSAPRLQPIAARIVMLQSGMRAPMGVKIKGPDLATIEKLGFGIERLLKEVPVVEPSAVIADRIVGKPYLEIHIDREAVARYGIMLEDVQNVLETAVGGMPMTTTVEGRERYPVRVRYLRELRDNPDDFGSILVSGMGGVQIPLSQLSRIEYVRGPDMIKSEDTFLTGYVLFDKKPQYAEVDVVEAARDYLDGKVRSGELPIPAGASYTFAGSYENQVRSQKTLALVLPLALTVIFLILYLQFRTVPVTFLVFTGVFISAAGGFIMIWLYGQPWFLNFSLFGVHFRELFQVHPINLSVAVWVGFLALFGIASDDGVIQATYLKEVFARKKPGTVPEIRQAALEAGLRRIRPCLMTTATTILALIPVLTSTGRGSDIMVPMAIPSFGGMLIEGISLFIVPVIYAWMEERKMNARIEPVANMQPTVS